MTNRNLPSVIYHNLNELIQLNELNVALSAASEQLDKGHISSIINAFFLNTKVCVNGIPYIKVKGLSSILRTGNSGAERPLVYQGLKGVIAPAEIIEIESEDHISGPTLISLIHTRINFKSGTTKQYLTIALDLYSKIINLAEVRNLKDVFIEQLQSYRPYLKKDRIELFGIKCCEFSGQPFSNYNDVEFAHIDSVAINPLKALSLNNGVIILKSIHSELTRQRIHTFEEMYKFCQDNNYSTNWS